MFKPSAERVLSGVYDSDNNALRTVSNVTAVVSGQQSVEIDSTEDSVAIGGTDGIKATVTPAHALKVDNSAVNQPIKSPGFSTATTLSAQISVTTSTTLILPANPNRVYAHIINNSASIIYLQFGTAAVVGQGIKMFPGVMYTISGFELWQGDINAISASGTVNVDRFEGI